MESDLRIILNRMGGEELVLSFDRRLEQLSSEVIEGRVLPTKDWSRLLADENLTAATKAELIDQMGDTVSTKLSPLSILLIFVIKLRAS